MINQRSKQPDLTDQAVFQFRPFSVPVALADISVIHGYPQQYSGIELINGKTITVCRTLKHIDGLALPGLVRVNKQCILPLHTIRAVYYMADKTKHKSHNYRIEVETIYFKRFIVSVRREETMVVLLGTSVKLLRESKKQIHVLIP